MQLILICALLMFALCFSDVVWSNGRKGLALKQPMPFGAYLATPMIQTEPIARLMVLGLIASAYVYAQTGLSSVVAFDTLIWDSLGCFNMVLLCLSAAAAVSLALQSFKRFGRFEFLLLIWLTTLGMLCLIKSVNFLAFYLSVELQSLSSFMLAAMRCRTEASAEAGLKYFILSAFSSAILLLGMCITYGALGSQNFDDVALALTHCSEVSVGSLSAEHADTQAKIILGLSCICVSLLFKLAAAPLHMWVADVYEGSSTAITAFFAIASKIAVATALIRVLNLMPASADLLTGVAIASLVVGSLSAMRQVKLKRLMAFSGVANVGWFLLALVAGQWQLLVLHMIIYVWLSITLFSVFITPLFRSHPDLHYAQRQTVADHGADSSTIKYISDLNQMYKVNPGVALAVIIALFSLAGMPPLAGFYSKYLIINALAQNQTYAVLAIALGVAVLSAFYYVRVIKQIGFASNLKQGRGLNTQWWFTFQVANVNAVLICWTTLVTITGFIKPDYVCVWLLLV